METIQLEWKPDKDYPNQLVAQGIALSMFVLSPDYNLYQTEYITEGFITIKNFGLCFGLEHAKQTCQDYHDAMIQEWLVKSKPEINDQRIITL